MLKIAGKIQRNKKDDLIVKVPALSLDEKIDDTGWGAAIDEATSLVIEKLREEGLANPRVKDLRITVSLALKTESVKDRSLKEFDEAA